MEIRLPKEEVMYSDFSPSVQITLEADVGEPIPKKATSNLSHKS